MKTLTAHCRFALTLSCTFGVALAALGAENDQQLGNLSFDWQKIKLEETIQNRANVILSTLLSGKEFYVRTQIITLQQKVEKRQPAASTTLSFGKLDMSVEVPNYSMLEQKSLFDLLDHVDIVASIPKSILDANQDLIVKTLSSSIQALANTPVKVSLEPLVTAKPPASDAEVDKSLKQKAEEEKKALRNGTDILPQILKQALPIAVFLASLILASFLYWLLAAYRSVETAKLTALERSSNAADGSLNNLNSASVGNLGETRRDALENSLISKTLPEQVKIDEQIRDCALASPRKVLSLIHRWLGSEDIEATESLHALTSILPMNLLFNLVEQLDANAKRRWRSVLDEPVTFGFELRSRVRIFQQLVNNAMIQGPEVGEDVREAIQGIRPDECAELAQKDPALGAILGHLLSTPQAARMLSLMPDDLAGAVAVSSLGITTEKLKEMLPVLRKSLTEIRVSTVTEVAPLVERAVELLKEMGPFREKAIFASLAVNCENKEFKKITELVCPAEVIIKAPPTLHRQCLGEMPLAQRAELIHSLSNNLRTMLLNAYGAEEKIRELLEAEISQIDIDAQRKQRVAHESDKKWRTYVFAFRKMSQETPTSSEILRPLVETWLAAQRAKASADIAKVNHAA